ncbi:class A beta-lactamase-related serine hydrolase [Mycobacterium sp. 21AC1]|uniref:serine hydrolase n=1 Tax=[Mycobacterium] appelbergii TaxID=2939269 RepID=UPI00293910EF|nr:serine hydrolase [Mycobacterium sp. 21AC1]MDV3123483.1 class A beta-lactamase-related serine hydrolase [Mycobacterium sp. 21AC1]
MRRRLLNRAVTGMAIICVGLLASGCTAQAWSAPPAAPFDGLDARARQAIADAAESGADIQTVVLDRTTGQIVSNGADTAFPVASVVKLFIADDLLLQESEGKTKLSAADRSSIDLMLRSSDDSAAQNFWDRSGGNAIIARVKARYGLAGTTAPSNGHWDVTTSTASDLVRYYRMLLDGSGGLPPAQANIIVGNLARSTPTGTDGYPQRFGIPEGLYGEPVAVKQGWFCCWNGGNQLHVSTGIIGPERRYVMAISSLDPTDAATARANITQAVKTMFPGGKI